MTTSAAEKTIPAHVSLTQLVRSPEYQVRKRLDLPTVSRYETAMKAGHEFPAVKVAKVGETLILVDGFHRAAARERLGEEWITAEVVETTEDEAKWMAASANLRHGLPLTNSEIRETFRVYVRTKQYLTSNGRKTKPYREIAQEVGKQHTTVRNWMREDFPHIFRRYAGAEDFVGEGGLPEEDRPPEAVAKGLQAISEFREVYQGTASVEERQQLAAALTELARGLLDKGWERRDLDDF